MTKWPLAIMLLSAGVVVRARIRCSSAARSADVRSGQYFAPLMSAE